MPNDLNYGHQIFVDFEGVLCFAEENDFCTVSEALRVRPIRTWQHLETFDTDWERKECSPRDAVNTLSGIFGRGEGGAAEEKIKVSPEDKSFTLKIKISPKR